MNIREKYEKYSPYTEQFQPYGGLNRSYVKHQNYTHINMEQNNFKNESSITLEPIQILKYNFINIQEQDNYQLKFIKYLVQLQNSLLYKENDKIMKLTQKLKQILEENQILKQYHQQLYEYQDKLKDLNEKVIQIYKIIVRITLKQIENRPYKVIIEKFDPNQLQDKVSCKLYFDNYQQYDSGQRLVTGSFFVLLCCQYALTLSSLDYEKLVNEYNRRQMHKIYKIQEIYQMQQKQHDQENLILTLRTQIDNNKFNYTISQIFGKSKSNENIDLQQTLPQLPQLSREKSRQSQQREIEQQPQQENQIQQLPQLDNKSQIIEQIHKTQHIEEQQEQEQNVEQTQQNEKINNMKEIQNITNNIKDEQVKRISMNKEDIEEQNNQIQDQFDIQTNEIERKYIETLSQESFDNSQDQIINNQNQKDEKDSQNQKEQMSNIGDFDFD